MFKDDILKLIDSGINFNFSILNENFLYELMKLEKQSSLSKEQKQARLFGLIFSQLKKLIEKNKAKVTNYHKTETALVERYKKLKSLFKGPENLLELAKIMNGISADEIIIAKKKLKAPIIIYMEKYIAENPEIFEKFSGLKEMVKTSLDIVDTLVDEKLIKEAIDFGRKVVEKGVEKPEEYNGMMEPSKLFEMSVKMGLEQEFRSLIVGLTNHLNKLTDRIEDEEISATESEVIINNFKQALESNIPLPEPTEESIDGIVDSLGKIWSSIDKTKVLTETFFNIDKSLSTIQSKGEWYKDPLKIGLLTVSVIMISGLVGWLFFRKKNNRANYD